MEVIMRIGTTLITATTLLALSVVFQAAKAQNPDPASVLKRYVEALNAGDLHTALAQWAEDGVITSTRGRRNAGHESLRQFIQRNISRKIKQEPEAVRTVGDRVTWINRESNESYRKLNVAPVQQNSEIVVREGKIKTWVNYFPSAEIARIEEACARPQAHGVLLNNEPCSQFVELAKAHTAKLLGMGSSEKR